MTTVEKILALGLTDEQSLQVLRLVQVERLEAIIRYLDPVRDIAAIEQLESVITAIQ